MSDSLKFQLHVTERHTNLCDASIQSMIFLEPRASKYVEFYSNKTWRILRSLETETNEWHHSGCKVHEQHTRKHTAMSDARKTIPAGRTPGKTPGTALYLIRPPLQWCMVEAASCCGGIPQLVDMVARVISAKHIHSLKVRCSTAISPGTGDSPSSPTKLEMIS